MEVSPLPCPMHLIVLFIILLTACMPTIPVEVSTSSSSSPPSSSQSKLPIFSAPLLRTNERTILKPFGINISPSNSPVRPEKFSGFHTGIDYEILDHEVATDVPVFAVCDGLISERKYVSGYGGVLVQECVIDDEAVTVLYGHLRLASIEKRPQDNLTAGEKIGVLGTGYSDETDGERKHLHLSMHRGSAVEMRGYVQSEEVLQRWIDPQQLLENTTD
jgi:hypothetical protein